jgi:hypothetical protein
MLIAILVFCSMLFMDIFEAIKIDALSNEGWSKWRRRIVASLSEVGHDEGSAFAVGVGGASIFHYGVCLTSGMILLALALAAVIGTTCGDMVNSWLSDRDNRRRKSCTQPRKRRGFPA